MLGLFVLLHLLWYFITSPEEKKGALLISSWCLTLYYSLLFLIPTSTSDADDGFTYNGFPLGMLWLDGAASITSRALMLTDGTPQSAGRAFFGRRFEFYSISSFSATFVFLITSQYSGLSSQGLAFTFSGMTDSLLDSLPVQYLGLFDSQNIGNSRNHFFAVEFDTIINAEFNDIYDNHIGIDINSMISINSHTAGYYTLNGAFSPLRLSSDEPMQVWVDYDGNLCKLDVTLAPYFEPKPQHPLLSSNVNLSDVLGGSGYVGFSSASGTVKSIHRIIGWSFNPNGVAEPLNYSALSEVIEDVRQKAQSHSHIRMSILLPAVVISVFIMLGILVVLYVYMKKARKNGEKVVLHQDIKTSNVLLDSEMNGQLGDFGLARLHNHGADAHTMHFAGTWGYIAPELARFGRATKATDVFAFGVLVLEVACGRRPIKVSDTGEPVLLSDWVLHAWESISILKTVDPRLLDYTREEVELVLKLGLLCSHLVPGTRPCMRRVMRYLVKDAPLPDFQPSFLSLASRDEDFDQHILSFPSVATTMTGLSEGR